MGNRCDKISEKDFRLIIRNLGKKKNGLMYQLILLFEYQIGLRVGDAISLQRRHLVDKIGRIKKCFVLSENKTGKERTKKITDEIYKLLQIYMPIVEKRGLRYPESYLFPGEKKVLNKYTHRQLKRDHITRQAVYKVIRKACKELGIKGTVANHSMRRSFAVNVRSFAVKNLPDVNPDEFGKNATGHSSLDNFMVYAAGKESDPFSYINEIFPKQLTEW